MEIRAVPAVACSINGIEHPPACRVEMPRKVTPRQRELLEEFAGRRPPPSATAADEKKEEEPKKKGWFG